LRELIETAYEMSIVFPSYIQKLSMIAYENRL
jgi:hypothetical protein